MRILDNDAWLLDETSAASAKRVPHVRARVLLWRQMLLCSHLLPLYITFNALFVTAAAWN